MCDLLQIPSESFLTRTMYEHILDGEQELDGEPLSELPRFAAAPIP